MARFYQTSNAQYVDYLQPQEGAAEGAGATISSAFGDIKSIPEDRQILAETLAGYESEINQLTQELQANPKGLKALEPRISSLRQRIAMDRQTGVLKAIGDRYAQDEATRKGILDNLKDDPFQATRATQLYQASIQPLGFDPETKTYNQIAPFQVAKPFLQPQQQDWAKTYGDQIQETLLDEFSRKENLDQYNTLFTRGELEGVTADRALRILAQRVTPDMIAAADQQRVFYGLQGDSEQNFLTPDGKPNLNTQLGRLISSTADSVTRTTMDAFRTKTENVGAIEQAKYRVQNQDAEWWSRRIGTIWRNAGTDNPASRNQAVVGEVTSALRGIKTPDGYVVERIEIGDDGKPYVVQKKSGTPPELKDFPTTDLYDEAVRQWERSAEQRRVQFDISSLPAYGFSEQYTAKIGTAARNLPNYSEVREDFEGRDTGITQQRTGARTQGRRTRETGQSIVADVFARNNSAPLTPTIVNQIRDTARRAGLELTEDEVRDEYNRLSAGVQPVERPAPGRPQQPRRPQQGQPQGQQQGQQREQSRVSWQQISGE
jgi:hypothetical protein